MRNTQQKQPKEKRTLFQWGAELLSKTVAVVSSVMLVAPSYNATIGWVRDYIAAQYGSSFVGLASIGWFIAVAIICFGFVSLVFIVFINKIGLFFSSRR